VPSTSASVGSAAARACACRGGAASAALT
jgi:hypothetical protein